MDRVSIINKYTNEEDKLFVAKILDKIKLSKTRNKIENTDFLNMYEQKICKNLLEITKEQNYTFYTPCEGLEKSILLVYPEKYEQIFENNKFNYSNVISVIRITLPNELIGGYSHKDYLSGIMKLGIKREKVGDIVAFENGADIVCCKDITTYLLNNIPELTRFSKAKIEQIDLQEIRKPEIKKEQKRITVASLRLDGIVAELANCSRNEACRIIGEQRVMVNYEYEMKNSKILNEKDIVVIRGKGKFEISEIQGETKKGKIAIIVEHYI